MSNQQKPDPHGFGRNLVLTYCLLRHSPIVSFSIICCMASELEPAKVNFSITNRNIFNMLSLMLCQRFASAVPRIRSSMVHPCKVWRMKRLFIVGRHQWLVVCEAKFMITFLVSLVCVLGFWEKKIIKMQSYGVLVIPAASKFALSKKKKIQ